MLVNMEDNNDTTIAVIAAAHAVARANIDQPWELCEKGLIALRHVAAKLDRRWLE